MKTKKLKSKVARLFWVKKEIDGEVFYRLTGFENVYNRRELPNLYLQTSPNFYAKIDEIVITKKIDSSSIYPWINLNTVGIYSQEDFDVIISTMKEAGNRLAKINKSGKSFTVEI
jgi:hypothetical protein